MIPSYHNTDIGGNWSYVTPFNHGPGATSSYHHDSRSIPDNFERDIDTAAVFRGDPTTRGDVFSSVRVEVTK